MTTKFFLASAILVSALCGTSVAASTVTSTSYGSFSVPQSGTFADLDIYNHDTGLWLGQGGFEGDGEVDLYFGENPGGLQARFGGNSREIDGDQVNFLVFTNGPSVTDDDSQGLALNFASQSSIGLSDVVVGGMNGSGALYNQSGLGPLDLAPTGVFGFMMEVYSGGPTCDEEELDCALLEDAPLLDEGDGLGSGDLVSQHFGFIELSRGSVIGGTFGVNTSFGQSVTIQNLSGAPATVPLPASVLFLGVGLAGLGAIGRRRQKPA